MWDSKVNVWPVLWYHHYCIISCGTMWFPLLIIARYSLFSIFELKISRVLTANKQTCLDQITFSGTSPLYLPPGPTYPVYAPYQWLLDVCVPAASRHGRRRIPSRHCGGLRLSLSTCGELGGLLTIRICHSGHGKVSTATEEDYIMHPQILMPVMVYHGNHLDYVITIHVTHNYFNTMSLCKILYHTWLI